jgi:hypothetical protein
MCANSSNVQPLPVIALSPKRGLSLFQAILFLLLVPTSAAADREPVLLAQLQIEQRVIIRVPMARPPARARVPDPPKLDFNEKKGPRCIAIRSIRSAGITSDDGVDMILTNGQRYRARLEKACRAADFYMGFYIEPTEDGSLCAQRDDLQARGGRECEITAFRQLVPEK